MPRIEFPGFCGPHYDYSHFPGGGIGMDFAVCQNLYPETAQQFSRQRHFLIGRPGMGGFTVLATSPVRGLFSSQTNSLFAVGGTHLYSIVPGPTVTDRGSMAGSTGLGPAYLSYMGAGTSANPIVVCDTSSNQIYTTTGAAMVSQFNGTAIEYLDGFMVTIATGASLQNASQPNQVNVSAFGDPTNWTPGPGATQAFAIRTGGNDFINQLAVLNGFLWIFGQKTIEIWFNAGLSPFPFQRYQGATINLGCLAPASVVKFLNTIVWLGADHTGYPQVYMTKGMSPVRISDPAIEGYIQNLVNGGSVGLIASAWAHGYQEAGHTFWEIVFQTGGNSALTTTLVYDLTEGIWHTRNYQGLIPVVAQACSALQTTGFENLVGSYSTGQIMVQSVQITHDVTSGGANANIVYQRNAPYVSEMSMVSRHKRFEIVGNFGTAVPTLSISDDMGATFRQNYNLTGPGTDQGWNSASPFQRWYAQQLGRSRARIYQLNITDQANPIRIAGAYLDIDQGIGQ